MTVEALGPLSNTSHPDGPLKTEKLEQLARLMESRVLHGADSLRSFLQYITFRAIEHQEGQLKEYTIATDVFGRAKDFDSRTDSVVRVQAKRLREKLKEYYDTDGKSDRILIDLPKGHYNVVFSYLAPQKPEDQLEAGVDHERDASAPRQEPGLGLRQKAARLLPITAAVLTIAVVALA